jgi:thiazole synthase ThiGH ThiG subunit
MANRHQRRVFMTSRLRVLATQYVARDARRVVPNTTANREAAELLQAAGTAREVVRDLARKYPR